MPVFDLFSIGHSSVAADTFVAMLKRAGVDMIADVRSVPHSRRHPWFSKTTLEASLKNSAIAYAPMGDALGGRPRDETLYREGIADYEAMARAPLYQAGLGRLIEFAMRSRVCVMCAEREPLDCHRCLLVARSLAERGMTIGHILHDGTIEPHAATEQRLLALYDEACDLFAPGQPALIAAAYRRRASDVAFRQKAPTSGSAADKR